MPRFILKIGAVSGFAGLLALGAAAIVPAAERTAFRSVEVVGTEFRVASDDGTVLQGAALVGAVLTIAGPAGRPVRLRIDSVERDAQDPEVVLHGFSTWNPASGGWDDLCQPDAQGVRQGFPMRGALAGDSEYQPDAPGFSLTCSAGVQAKCVRWGYKPWKADVDGVRMLDLYRACMRMTRADYCGDGRGTTRNGTPIDLYDRVGIQKPEPRSAMSFEAAWGPQGALCVRHTRVPQNITLHELASTCPRLAPTLGERCGEDMPGALLFNKSF